MNDRQLRALTTARAVDGFLTEHADRLPSIVDAGVRHRLRRAIAQLDTHTVDQSADDLRARGLTQANYALREALLRDHMAPIVRLAHIIADDGQVELSAVRMPRGDPSVETITGLAFAMADLVEPHAAQFIALGSRPSFVQELRAAAQRILDCVIERTEKRVHGVGATEGLKSQLQRTRRVIRAIDAMVQSALHDDSVRLAAWSVVKRVPRRPGRVRHRTPQTVSTVIALPIRDARRLLPRLAIPVENFLVRRDMDAERVSVATVSHSELPRASH